MGHLFYIYVLLTTVLLFPIITKFFRLKTIQEWYTKFEKVTGKKPLKSDFRSEEEYNLYISISIVSLLELFIIIGGLLSSSWYIYLVLFLLSIILTICLRPIQFTMVSKTILFINQLFRISCYVFMIINHFHIHLDIYNLIM